MCNYEEGVPEQADAVSGDVVLTDAERWDHIHVLACDRGNASCSAHQPGNWQHLAYDLADRLAALTQDRDRWREDWQASNERAEFLLSGLKRTTQQYAEARAERDRLAAALALALLPTQGHGPESEAGNAY